MSPSEPAWRRVATFSVLEDPGTAGFSHEAWDHWGFVVRDGDHLAAFVNVCPHAGHPLHWRPDGFMTADGEHIICASHGALFDRRTGVCVGGPCVGLALQPVPVRRRGDSVEVQLLPGVT
jgi:nitrite reductase/ring-hydroxylating ferredoxin subunit